MRTPSGITIAEERLAEICRQYHVRELALFGSVLREDFGPDSDVDVLVEFEPEAFVGLIHLGGLRENLEELTGRQIDLIPKKGLKPFIRDSVLDSRQVVYGASA